MADLRGVNPLGPAWATAPAVGGLSGGITPALPTDDGTGSDSQFVRGFRSALTGAKSAVQSYGGQLAELVGAEQAAQEMNQAAIENAALSEQQAPRVRTVRQVMEGGDRLNDAVDYATGVMGQAGPYLALGAAGGFAGRGAGLVSGMRAGLSGEALAARAGMAGNVGAAAAFHPIMAGDQAAQLRDDPAAAHMGIGERALRANAVGSLQSIANAAAPAHMVNRTFMRAPIAPGAMGMAQSAGRIGVGATETAALSGMGEMAEDVIGQAHRGQYDQNYRFNPEQMAEAGAAGFVGAAPISVGHAAGAEMLDTVNSGVPMAGNALLDKAERAVQIARQLGGEIYDELPTVAQDALKTVAATGQMTADAAAALAPHASNLGSAMADILANYYESTKANVKEYAADADIGLPPTAEDITGDAYVNAINAREQAKDEAAYAVKAFVDDPAVAALGSPVKDFLGKAKSKLDGLTRVATIMTDPAKWLHEGEKMTPEKLGNIKAAMNDPAKQKRYAKAVLDHLNSSPMEGQSAAEVRSLAERLNAGETLSPDEVVRMYAQFKLAAESNKTAEDMAQVLKFDDRLKAKQTVNNPLPAKFSRQKTKSAEDQWAKDLADQRSESFRNRISDHVREMFNSTPVGRDLLSRADGGAEHINAVIDFMSNVAEGKNGYDTKKAVNMALYLSSKFGPAGKAAIDNIIKVSDLEFGMDSKKAERIAGMRDSVSSMHSDAANMRDKLLKDKEADIKELVADVEGVQDIDANRASRERAILALRDRAGKEADPEKRFKLMEQAADAEDELRANGLGGLKEKWVNDGIVEPKNFDRLVEAVSKYSKHGERLSKPERRVAGHATEANYAAENLDDPDTMRATAENADNDARPGKDMSEADEIEAAENAEKGIQGGEDNNRIWVGTGAFNEGGHKASAIGAPLSRHVSGDYSEGDVPGTQYNAAIGATHAKYGHRVTRAHGVRPLAWAEEMAATEGQKSDYEYLDDAMKALLKEDQKRLKNEKLSEDDKKFIGLRAKLAKELQAEQVEKGGIKKFPAAGHFFASKMNQGYRYYRVEQHDASNLSYSTEQLQAAYAPRPADGSVGARKAAIRSYVAREAGRDGTARVLKKGEENSVVAGDGNGKFVDKVYVASLLPIVTAKGEVIDVDIAKLVTSAMRHHQSGDITGAGDKERPVSFAEEILSAFHTVVGALMTADGVHPSNPLGAKTGVGSVVFTADGQQHFDPSLVVFRDPTGRVLQELGEHVKVNSVRNFFTLGDLMEMQGVDEMTGKAIRTKKDSAPLLTIDGVKASQMPMAPGVFEQRDMDAIVQKTSQTNADKEGRRDTKAREAGNERGVAFRGLTFEGKQKTINVRALLTRMIERNGNDAQTAMYKANIPHKAIGDFLYEAMEEMKTLGFDGPLFDMAQTKFDNLVLMSGEYTADNGAKEKYSTTFGNVKDFIATNRYKAEQHTKDPSKNPPVSFDRDLQDAKVKEALSMLRDSEYDERTAMQRVNDGVARDNDNSEASIKARAAKVTKGLKDTGFAKGQLVDASGDVDTSPTKPLQYSYSEIDNFRLKGLLKEFAEMSGEKDAPLFDRSVEAIFSDTADMLATVGKFETSAAARKATGDTTRDVLDFNHNTVGESKTATASDTEQRAEAGALRARLDLIKEILEGVALKQRDNLSPEKRARLDKSQREAETKLKAIADAAEAAKTEPAGVSQTKGMQAYADYLAERKEELAGRAVSPADGDTFTSAKLKQAAMDGKAMPAAPLNKPVEPYAQPRIPANVKREAKIESKDVQTNKPNLLAAAKAARDESVAKAKKDLAAQLRGERAEKAETKRMAEAPAEEEAPVEPVKPVAKKAGGPGPGKRFNPKTGEFVDTNPGTPAFSRQSTTGTKDMFPEETKAALKAELNRLAKDAFGFEMPETLGEDISGSYLDKLIKVSQTASDPLGALHHEAWHGIEQLLGEMGENGKKVLADIYAHVSTTEMVEWLKTQYLNDGGVASQLTDKSERAAFAFQKFMAGEKMPIAIATKTRWEKIKAFIAKVAAKLGIETTTTGERTANFFGYVKEGSFARDMENVHSVRKGLGEKKGDDLMNTAAKHLKPFVEAFETVFQHSETRIRKLDVPEYNEVLRLYAGTSGKGGYYLEYNRNVNKWSAKLDELTDGMDDAKKLAFLSSPQYKGFRDKFEAYMKNGTGVADEDIVNMNNRLVSFNGDKIADNIEDFITDLVRHGGFSGKAGEARLIANKIADKGYFYDKDVELFKGKEAIKDKWIERDATTRVARYIERAVYMAEQHRAFSDGKTMRGKLDALVEAGGAKSGPEGRKLVEDYMLAMEGRLGEGALSPTMKKLMGTMLFANNVAILPMAVFSQMLDPMNMALRKNSMHGSLDAMWRGVSEMPKSFDKFKGNYSKDYWETLANQVGSAPTRIVTNVMSNLMNGMEVKGQIGKMNETFFKFNFMDQWNRSMHVEATKHAVEFLREHADNVAKKQGGVDEDGTLRSQRFLDELNLKHTDVKFNAAGELILNDKVESAIVQYVEEALAHPDAGSNPMWMNDPRFALISQMKRFTFAHAKYVLGRGMTELSKGNAFPLAPMAIAMPWMMAADGLRNTLTGAEGYQATSALDEAKHLAERAGHFGRGQFGLDIDAAITRGESPVEALLGPSVERFGDVARGLHNGNLIDEMTR